MKTRQTLLCLFILKNTDLGGAFTQNFSLRIRRNIKDLIDLTHSDNVSSSISSLITHGVFFNGTHYYFKIVVPVDMMWFPEFKSVREDHPEIILVGYIKVARNDMSRWVIIEMRMGTITFYVFFLSIPNLNVKVLQCPFVTEKNR